MGYDSTLRDFRSLVHDPTSLLSEVRSVAVDHVREDIKRPWEAYNKACFIRSFPKLEEIIIVLNDEQGEEGGVIGVNEEVEFVEPKGDPERLLMVWYFFRQSFLQEEMVLEEVCRESGREYEMFNLPVARIRRKVRKVDAGTREAGRRNRNGITAIERALERLEL